MLLFSMTMSYAQVVSVPSGCTVVVAGVGGTLGTSVSVPPGRVGNGGVVIMPDPSGGGTFNFTIAGSPTTASWALRGDLSTTNVAGTNPLFIGNYNGATQSTTGSSATINTYNKDLRIASTEAANPSWARSKGLVTVSWTSPPCNNSITFEVFKTFTSIPAIVGPTCLESGKQYTFSIDQIASDNANDNIGFDKYYWSGIPAGITSFYYSADNSSITFTMAGGTVPATTALRCCVGRFNTTGNADGGNGPNLTLPSANYLTCTTLNLTPLTAAPSYSTAPPTCHPTGTGSFNIVYPNAVLPLTYTWTAPNTGWTINNPVVGATNTTVTVNTPNNNPGILTLTITGSPCGAIPPINYQVNRSLTGTTLIVPNTTSPGSICMTAGTSNNQFFLGANASANNVTWTVTSPTTGAAANITLSAVVGQPSSTVAVAIGANAPVNATYTLTATANTLPACNASSATYTFNVRPQTPVITGVSCVVKGALTAQTYTCTNIVGASYNWVFPAGWTRVGGFTTTTNIITVTPASATAVLNGNVTVVATGVGTCNSLTSAPFAINYSPIAPSTLTFSNTCYNFGLETTGTITVANRPSPFYGDYTVTSSPAGLYSSVTVDATTGIISFATAANASGSYVITITHKTPTCGNATTVYTTTPIVISSNGATIPAPTLDSTVGECDTYSVTNRPAGSNASNTKWFVNGNLVTSNGTTVFINPSASQLQLCGANTTITSVCVQVTSGCITRVCAPNVGTHGTAKLVNPANNAIKVYPNPNDGNFTINIEKVAKTATATVTDMTGKKIATYTLEQGENNIKNNALSAGSYLILIDIDGKKESHKLIVK